ncbi:hypothetical protein PBAL39_08549 [Pedobacter sp. BAL39]|nr:hypothetical protein PBAL39_08549 [Pedobacter sp. BAL39]
MIITNINSAFITLLNFKNGWQLALPLTLLINPDPPG